MNWPTYASGEQYSQILLFHFWFFLTRTLVNPTCLFPTTEIKKAENIALVSFAFASGIIITFMLFHGYEESFWCHFYLRWRRDHCKKHSRRLHLGYGEQLLLSLICME